MDFPETYFGPGFRITSDIYTTTTDFTPCKWKRPNIDTTLLSFCSETSIFLYTLLSLLTKYANVSHLRSLRCLLPKEKKGNMLSPSQKLAGRKGNGKQPDASSLTRAYPFQGWRKSLHTVTMHTGVLIYIALCPARPVERTSCKQIKSQWSVSDTAAPRDIKNLYYEDLPQDLPFWSSFLHLAAMMMNIT